MTATNQSQYEELWDVYNKRNNCKEMDVAKKEHMLYITGYLIGKVFANDTVMFASCGDDEKSDIIDDLLNIIASLHNELYKEINGKYYDYMFHWVNKTTGGCPTDGFDDLFKIKEDN